MDGLGNYIDQVMRDQALANAGNRTGKVTAVIGGYADITTPAGATIRHVQIGTRNQWKVGNGVTYERSSNGHLQIVGAAAAESE